MTFTQYSLILAQFILIRFFYKNSYLINKFNKDQDIQKFQNSFINDTGYNFLIIYIYILSYKNYALKEKNSVE